MPIPLLQAHLTMLPRLEAEESIVAAERMAVGSGSMKPAPRRDVVAGWRRAAKVDAARRATDPEGHRALAAAAGIGVRVVSRKPS